MSSEDSKRQAYKALIRLIHWKVHRAYEPDHWALNFEDLEAECLLALSRCIDKYLDRVPFDEFLKLARTAIGRAIKDVQTMVYGTHRRAERNILSLQDTPPGAGEYEYDDGVLLEDVIPGGVRPDDVYDAMEYVSMLADQLEPDEAMVLAALLGYEPRMPSVLEAVRLRREAVFKDANIRMTPHILSVATTVPKPDVNSALRRLDELLTGGIDGYSD